MYVSCTTFGCKSTWKRNLFVLHCSSQVHTLSSQGAIPVTRNKSKGFYQVHFCLRKRTWEVDNKRERAERGSQFTAREYIHRQKNPPDQLKQKLTEAGNGSAENCYPSARVGSVDGGVERKVKSSNGRYIPRRTRAPRNASSTLVPYLAASGVNCSASDFDGTRRPARMRGELTSMTRREHGTSRDAQ